MASPQPTIPICDVLRDLNLEPATLQFYQASFADVLTPRKPGRILRELPRTDVETLKVVHHLLSVRQLSVPEALGYLIKRRDTRTALAEDGHVSNLASLELNPTINGERRYGKVVTITSGKGGVGKTTVSLNLACELARMGMKVALIDADLGLANVHILAGLSPRAGLEEVVDGRITMRQALTPGPRGINVLAGASGLLGLAELNTPDRSRLVSQLTEIQQDHDVILIDTGAGLSQRVLDFITCADEVIVVTTSDLTAIADAYAMVKVISRRDAELPIRLLVNRVASAYEATVVSRRIMRCAEKFLEHEIGDVGYILEDPSVSRAIKERTPFVIGHPRSRAAKTVRRVAEQLMALELRRGSSGSPRATLARLMDVMRPVALDTTATVRFGES